MSKILIAEDETYVTELISEILKAAGHETIIAYNGQEALERTLKDKPDLVITDILMPIMDGFAFYKALKNDPRIRYIPVIILTARKQMEDTFRVLGVNEFVEKRDETNILLAAINRVLGQSSVKESVKKRVLVAGVNQEVVNAMVQELTSKGQSAASVLSGPEVITQSVAFKPDVIILDIQMMGTESSAEIIKALRLLPEFREIPIILYSYYSITDLGKVAFQEHRQAVERCKKECFAAGTTHYIGKFDVQVFWKLVKQYILENA